MSDAAFPQVDAAPYAWPFDGAWSSADTALLLLGFQRQTVKLYDARAAVDHAAGVLAQCRTAGLTVVFSRQGRNGVLSPVAQRRGKVADPIPLRRSTAWQLVLEPLADEIIVDHRGDNAFYLTGLAETLRDRSIRNILVAGVPTDGLVHASMRAANDDGFECLAISDACRGTTMTRHDAQLIITTFGNGLFGAVAPAATVISALSAYDKKDLLP
jgi:nicotinamidase-related amidase